ncbi:MAG: hypothetical protein HC841_00155 [Verrucomicrobiae bacterium]|nr:hypothetical protein [Verrucomicrobiae bacterium]
MKLQFQIPTHERRVYVNDTWISNGHWMIRKAAAMHIPSLKTALKRWSSLIPGAYEGGEHLGDGAKLPDFERIIPSMTDYARATLSGRVAYDTCALPTIRSVFLETEDGRRAAIGPRYAGLLQLGQVYIKNSTDPVVIQDGAGEVAAIIMPRREEA